jgi:hypothetical protein
MIERAWLQRYDVRPNPGWKRIVQSGDTANNSLKEKAFALVHRYQPSNILIEDAGVGKKVSSLPTAPMQQIAHRATMVLPPIENSACMPDLYAATIPFI